MWNQKAAKVFCLTNKLVLFFSSVWHIHNSATQIRSTLEFKDLVSLWMLNVRFLILFNYKQDHNSKTIQDRLNLVSGCFDENFWAFDLYFFHSSTRGKAFWAFLCIKCLHLNQNSLFWCSLSRRDPATQTSLLVETWDPYRNISTTVGLDEWQRWKFVGQLQLVLQLSFGERGTGKFGINHLC